MIEVDGVTVRYDDSSATGASKRGDRSVAVDDVSTTVDDGEWVVVAGANGSGKTSLVRTFNGLIEPDAGEVRVDGTPVSEDLVTARSAVGMAFQDPRDGIVAATVGADVSFGPENLGLERAEIDRRVGDALAAVGLEGRENDRVDTLSGGERERLAVAGALAMEPAHLVLDEPFTGLDEPSRRRLLGRLHELHADGTGLVVVTHDLRDVLAPADRLVVLDGGRIVVDGPPEAAVRRLRSDCGSDDAGEIASDDTGEIASDDANGSAFGVRIPAEWTGR